TGGRGGAPCRRGGTGDLGRRHPDRKPETAQELLRGDRFRPAFARGREGDGDTARGGDDQAAGGGFGRAQQAQYSAPEVAGERGAAGTCLGLVGRPTRRDGRGNYPHPAVWRPPPTSPQGGGGSGSTFGSHVSPPRRPF